MTQLPCILTAALLLTLAACATPKKAESDTESSATAGCRGIGPGQIGRSALLYRYADPEASPDGAILVMVKQADQTVYSIQLDRIESFQTREGVRYGSSEALVRASFGKPQSIQESVAGEIPRAYCYLSGLAVRLNATGHVESLTIFPGSDLRKICKAQ